VEQAKKESIPTRSRWDLLFKIVGIGAIIIMLGVLGYRYIDGRPDTTYCRVLEHVEEDGVKGDICVLMKVVSTDLTNPASGPTIGTTCADKLTDLDVCPDGKKYFGVFPTELGYYCLGYITNFQEISEEDLFYLDSQFKKNDFNSYSELHEMVEDCEGEIDG
jgi:hypothetical protein